VTGSARVCSRDSCGRLRRDCCGAVGVPNLRHRREQGETAVSADRCGVSAHASPGDFAMELVNVCKFNFGDGSIGAEARQNISADNFAGGAFMIGDEVDPVGTEPGNRLVLLSCYRGAAYAFRLLSCSRVGTYGARFLTGVLRADIAGVAEDNAGALAVKSLIANPSFLACRCGDADAEAGNLRIPDERVSSFWAFEFFDGCGVENYSPLWRL
jgi:hypothetical protein